MKRPTLKALTLLIASAMLALAACGSSDDSGGGTSSGSAAKSSPVKITVFAAASLTDAFTTIGKDYEKANPNTTVTFNFAGSNTLVQQISQGAPADAFASADTQNMDKLTKQDLMGTPETFAKNSLVVAIPKSNPGKIENLKDLANDGVKIAVADPNVPVGNYTNEVLDKMGKSDDYGPSYVKAVKANIVTKETSVTAVLQKVQTGDVDAGYVYVSDAFSAQDDTTSIAIPEKYNILADYPIATVKASKNAAAADAFVKYVLSAPGQKTLQDYKFLPASAS